MYILISAKHFWSHDIYVGKIVRWDFFFIVSTIIPNSPMTSNINKKKIKYSHHYSDTLYDLASAYLSNFVLYPISCSLSRLQQHGVLPVPNICQAFCYLRAFALAVPSGWNIVNPSDLNRWLCLIIQSSPERPSWRGFSWSPC